MPHESTPRPLVTSEKIPHFDNVEDPKERARMEGASLMAKLVGDPYGTGEAVSDNSVNRDGLRQSNVTRHDVRRWQANADTPPTFFFTLSRNVSESLQPENIAGKIEVEMDTSGNVLYSDSYTATTEGGVQHHELSPADAVNAVSEAYSAVRNANLEQNRIQNAQQRAESAAFIAAGHAAEQGQRVA